MSATSLTVVASNTAPKVASIPTSPVTRCDTNVEARLLRAMRRGASSTIAFISVQLEIEWISASVEALLGYQPGQLLGINVVSLVHPEDHPEVIHLIEAESNHPTAFERSGSGRLALQTLRLRKADDTYRNVQVSIGSYVDDATINGYVAQVFDADVQSATIGAYRGIVEASDPDDALSAIASSIAIQLDDSKVLIEADLFMNRMDAQDLARMRALSLDDEAVLVVPVEIEGQRIGQITVEDTSGRNFTFWSGELVQRSARLVERVVEQEWAKRHMARAAATDALTGIGNRLALHDALGNARQVTLAPSEYLGVLFVDLDGFKAINDRHGHLAGDVVLKEVATRLQQLVRSTDVATRVGGDEFCLLCRFDRPTDAQALGERALAAIVEPIRVDALGGLEVHVSATIGISVTHDPARAADLVNHADRLLIESKTSHRHSATLGHLPE